MSKKRRKSNVSTLNTLLTSIERLFLSVIIALIPPIFLGLAGWWISIPFVPEKQILYFALGGFLSGVLVDLIFLRRWTRKALTVSIFWPGAVYVLFSIGVLGFFMGVPIFNLLLGPVWGYYMGMRLRVRSADRSNIAEAAHKSGLFTSMSLAIISLASLVIAYLDPSLEANIQGMFGLAQPLDRSLILMLSAIAGLIMVLLEYLVTRAAVRFASFLDKLNGYY